MSARLVLVSVGFGTTLVHQNKGTFQGLPFPNQSQRLANKTKWLKEWGCLRAGRMAAQDSKLDRAEYLTPDLELFFYGFDIIPHLIASAISSSDFPKNLRQWRAKSGVDISTRFRFSFED